MKGRIVVAVCSALLLIPAWFLLVDRSWFIDDCPDCGYSSDVLQYRVAGWAIHEDTRNDFSILQRFAADLGTECTHPQITRWHQHRYWGLWFCASPCINGLHGLYEDDSWYDSSTTAQVKAFAKANPSLHAEFSQRVLKDHDFTFFRETLRRSGVAQEDREAERLTK